MQSNTILALDFGGTKLAAAVVDIESGAILAAERHATPAEHGAEASLEAMVDLGQRALRASGAAAGGIGISFGGPVNADRRSVMRSLHVSDWDDFPLPAKISEIFDLPAYMDNDGNAAALGEWRFGAGASAGGATGRCENMLYVQVSTGVGSGLILRSKVYRGGGLAGEFGHLTVMADGPLCACGKRGCVEALSAGWALARDGRAAFPHAAPSSPLRRLAADDPQAIDGQLVLEAARQGDPLALGVVERGFLYLGIAISNAVALTDPQFIVLGGGVARAWDLLYPRLLASLAEYLPPMFRDRVSLAQSTLNGTETLLGAALLTVGY